MYLYIYIYLYTCISWVRVSPDIYTYIHTVLSGCFFWIHPHTSHPISSASAGFGSPAPAPPSPPWAASAKVSANGAPPLVGSASVLRDCHLHEIAFV